MGSYRIRCCADMQRAVSADWSGNQLILGNAKQCNDLKFLNISR